MGRIIIAPHAGGLGDVLLYSTLPTMYAAAGDKVWWTSRVPFRNPEVRDLILSDPHIIGLSDDEPNAGAVMWKDNAFVREAKRIGNPIAAVESLHHFRPMHQRPIIYRKPRPYRSHLVYADPHSISQAIAPEVFADFVRWVCRWYLDIKSENVVFLHSRHSGRNGSPMSGATVYEVQDLDDYINCIYSARAFLVAESGGQVLASAIRKTEIYALFTTMAANDGIFTFPNVKYYYTGRMTPDYHYYPE